MCVSSSIGQALVSAAVFDCTRRPDKSTCFDADSPYYEATQHNVHPMMARFLIEADILGRRADADIDITNPNLDFMWRVGLNDLHYGLRQEQRLYVSYAEDMFSDMVLKHILLLVALLVSSVLMLWMLVKPYKELVQREMHQVC